MSTDTKLISVIVPVYKVEDYLVRCIDSLINQTYSFLQIILVDDGSPDRCGEICDRYAANDNRVIVIHKQNGGLSDARNVGIECATGEYISFLDSDDWLHPKYFQVLFELINNSAADIAICEFKRTPDEKCTLFSGNVQAFRELSNIEAVFQLLSGIGVSFVTAWGKLYRRSLFKKIRYPYNRIHEDEFITYKLLYSADKIVYTSEQLYFYFQREDSIMGTKKNHEKSDKDSLDAFRERVEYFDQVRQKQIYEVATRICFQYLIMILDRYGYWSKYRAKLIPKEYLTEFISWITQEYQKTNQQFIYRLFFKFYQIAPRLAYALFRRYEQRLLKGSLKNKQNIKVNDKVNP